MILKLVTVAFSQINPGLAIHECVVHMGMHHWLVVWNIFYFSIY